MDFFFDELDEVKTAENVRSFLKHDYPKICMALGRPVSYIQSPSMSGMPKAPSAGNAAEDRLVRVADMQMAVKWAREALRMVQTYDPDSGRLIIDCLVHKCSRDALADEMGYSRTSLQRMLQKACCQYAGYLSSCSGGRLDLVAWK